MISNPKIKIYSKVILFFILAIALTFLCILLVKEYRHSKRIEYINAQESIFKTLHGPKPITVEDIGSIQEWMTFDYINHLFGLPNDYLMTNLSITDSKYPKLTIRKYSLDKKTDLPTSIAEIQSAIKVYFAKK